MRSSDTLKPPKHRGDFLDVAAVNDSLSRPSLACYVGLLILAYLFSSRMNNGHVMRAFFKNIINNWSIWAFGPNKLWDTWGIFSLTKGQKISKAIYGILNSPKKRTKN